MTDRTATILDGMNRDDPVGSLVQKQIVAVYQNAGYKVNLHQMDDMDLAHCIGCFGCWVKTPGECIHKDAGREIARDMINSDTVVLLSPVVFGGYSSSLKRMVDRFIPLIHPNMMLRDGEVHHHRRYSRYPRMVGIGLQVYRDEESARVFRTLVGRNAINFHCPTYAAEVLLGVGDQDSLRRKLTVLLTREDPLPGRKVVTSMISGITADDVPSLPKEGTRRALLLIGSPKRTTSTSQVLGSYLLDRLDEKGWVTQTIKLQPKLFKDESLKQFLSLVDQADLLVTAFPLYVDSLPALLTQTLEVLRAGCQGYGPSKTRRLFAVVNNGFPEACQNGPALAICRHFAQETGMVWAGSLALGAGEALVGGQPLAGKRRSGPPIFHVVEALDKAAALIDQKGRVSLEDLQGLDKSPIPLVPFALWRRMFMLFAAMGWKKRASGNGLKGRQMSRRPYAR